MKIRSLLSSIATVAVLALSAGTASAAASSLSITPASGTINKGSNLNISIIETGDNVNVVTVNLNYDAAKLSCNGVGGGAFGGEISASCGGGKVTISRYVTPGQPALNGAQVVGTVNFTALVGSGTTSLTFGASQVASNGVNTLASSTGGTYTLATPSTSTGGSSSPAPTSPTTYGPKTTTPTKNTAVANTSNPATSSTSTVKESAVLSADSKKKDEAKATDSDDAAITTEKKSNTGRNLGIFAAVLAVAGAAVLGARRYQAGQAAAAAAAAAATKKTATKKAPAKKATAKKKPATRKK